MRLRKTGLRVAASFVLATTAILLVACTTPGVPVGISAEASSTAEEPPIRQTDDAGVPLPFDNKFPNRWSANNDGTAYEPCTQVSVDALSRVRVDLTSVEDVADSDHQTARGCTWKFDGEPLSSLSHFVGDLIDPGAGLDGYRKLNRGGTTWFPDREIAGRRVLAGATGANECTLIVRSGDAVVVSTIIRFDPSRPPAEVICRDVEAFLSSTISRVP